MTWLVSAALLAGSVAVFDVAASGALPVIDEGVPLASLPFLVRSVFLAASALAWVIGVDRLSARRTRSYEKPRAPSGLASRPAPIAAPIVAAAGGAVVLALLLRWPITYTVIALEDGPIEGMTAALLIAGALVMAARAVGLARQARRAAVILAVLAVGYFVLGMEEISWGQRLVGFGTPTAFSDNMQGEANLHNFATNALEVLFFTGTTVAFVIVPLLQHGTRVLDRWPSIAALTPSVTLLLAFAPAAAMTYDMWNISPVQFSFWITCVTLAYLAAPASRITIDRRTRDVAGLTLALCVATQVALLVAGGRTGRLWDATEYRELFTVGAMAWYALSLHGVPRPHDASAPPSPPSASAETSTATSGASPVPGSPPRP